MEVSSSAKSMISRYLRAMSLDKLVEMKFQLAGVICGATLISPCTERLDSQKHDIPFALNPQRQVAFQWKSDIADR